MRSARNPVLDDPQDLKEEWVDLDNIPAEMSNLILPPETEISDDTFPPRIGTFVA